MSLREYIDKEFPETERENVLNTIKKWLGNIELQVDMEKNPNYRTLIVGAINLMRHMSFEWVSPDDSATKIANRCLSLHIKNKHLLSYSTRFSTTEPKLLTLGLFFSVYDGEWKSDCFFCRYEILDNFMFKYKDCRTHYSFTDLLKRSVDHINKKMETTLGNNFVPFDYEQIQPLNVNHYSLIMEKLNYYVIENNLLMYNNIENDNNYENYVDTSNQIFTQGTKSWSY